MKKNNLLLVEDDFEIANKLYATFKDIDTIAIVDISENVKQGISKLSSSKYDILILDLNLPDGNGIEVLKWIKENKIDIKTYIFSLNVELKKICLKLGADRFFDKSKDFDTLKETLNSSDKQETS